MKKKTATPHPLARGKAALAKKTVSNHENAFRQVVAFIEAARDQAYRAVNTGLIDLYWRVGEFISRKITADGWGKNTVSDLSAFIQARRPGIADSPPQISGGCVNSTTLTSTSQNSHHCCEN